MATVLLSKLGHFSPEIATSAPLEYLFLKIPILICLSLIQLKKKTCRKYLIVLLHYIYFDKKCIVTCMCSVKETMIMKIFNC